jgi:hypothetical protein
MATTFKLLGAVALVTDIPEHHLQRGQVGTIVEVLSEDAFEVEFVDNEGLTYALLPLHAEQLLVLHYEPVA